MALTKNQHSLIQGLKILGIEREAIIGILLMMDTDEKADQMIDWLVATPGVTLSDILGKAIEISPYMEDEEETPEK